jgi:hypothetical protein
MNDTSPEVEQRYRQLLLQRSGAERLAMGCSMFATARALAIASVLEKEPFAPPATLRQALFVRFYGAEFTPEQRERIVARLGHDEAPSRRAPRRVPVNWDDLEVALATNPVEWTCYFDLRSGEVSMVPVDHLAADAECPSEEEVDTGLEAGHLIHIEPLDSRIEYGWMEEFTETVGDVRLRDQLGRALGGGRPFRRFKDALLDSPAERERWFAFRDERVRAAAQEWMEGQGIEPTTKPVEGNGG